MAPIIRQTWSEMRDETLRRMGKLNVPDWGPRMERFLASSYYDIAVTFHHYELEKAIQLGVPATDQEATWRFSADVGYPEGDLYSIMAVRLTDPDDGRIYQLGQENVKFTWSERRASGRPEKWARASNDSLLLDRPADKAYLLEVYCYTYPTPPDFAASDPSELGPVWDEHIMQRAMFLAAPATWRYDMSQVQVQTLQEFLQAQAQAPLKQGTVARDEVPLTSQNAGGGQ